MAEMLAPPPFIVFALPRSRTTWLSKFLAYGPWDVQHDALRYARSLEDCRVWLDVPFTGFVETSAAAHWRLAAKWRPDARVIVLRRSIDAVANSLARFGIAHEVSIPKLKRLDAKLRQISKRWPSLEIQYSDLDSVMGCQIVFEWCLGIPFDVAWWNAASPVNVQSSLSAMDRYVRAFGPVLAKLAAQAKAQTLADMAASPPPTKDEFVFDEIGFDDFLVAGRRLFASHSISVGEAPDSWASKNLDLHRQMESLGNLQIVVARANGRMFGYLMTLLAPSMEARDRRLGIHTLFFADPIVPGLGLRLQRDSLARLRAKGLDEVWWRAGPRGAGSRQSTLPRRLGASPDGELYRLDLKGI